MRPFPVRQEQISEEIVPVNEQGNPDRWLVIGNIDPQVMQSQHRDWDAVDDVGPIRMVGAAPEIEAVNSVRAQLELEPEAEQRHCGGAQGSHGQGQDHKQDLRAVVPVEHEHDFRDHQRTGKDDEKRLLE